MMIRNISLWILISGFVSGCAFMKPSGHPEAEQAALQSLEIYMDAFNDRNVEAWAATLNYPHVRVASGDVKVWQTAEEYAAGFSFEKFAETFGWDRSEWDSMEVIQSGEDKVHVAVQFSRYDADDNKLMTFKSFYIVTNHNGHWGTQARSSFAP